MRLITAVVLFTILLVSCKRDKGNDTDVFTEVYSVNNLPTQTFSINAGIDNIISGTKGTRIRIPANTFIDSSGHPVTGMVDIHLKEALTKVDMVLGNLTTTFNGKHLETGGMLFIDATSEGKNLLIAGSKSIYVALPADSVMSGMSVFTGNRDSSGISWTDPIPLAKPRAETADTIGAGMFLFEKTTNIKYTVDGFNNVADYPDTVNNEVSRIAWEGDGLKISKDSVFQIGRYTVRFYKQDRLQKWNEVFNPEEGVNNAGNDPNEVFIEKEGVNNFSEDDNTHYIFELKKLGWANIDRLSEDPRTREVNLITSIENQNDFKFVYVTLVTQRMYLPGYLKKDKTFGFSHGDEEPQRLPVGETATIIATAYKNDKPYFAIKKITIADSQTITFKLAETTVDKLKVALQTNI